MPANLEDAHEMVRKIVDRFGGGKLCDRLEMAKIWPNQITFVNILLGLVAVWSLFEDVWLTSGLLLIMMLVDGFDGYYAVRSRRVTKLGEWLDHGGDVMIGVLLMGKTYWYFGEWWMLMATGLYLFELGLMLIFGWKREKFPGRGFLYLFVFGWYWQGMVLQLVWQPVSLLGFLMMRRKK